MFEFMIITLFIILVIIQIFLIVNKASIIFYFLIFLPTLFMLFIIFDHDFLKKIKDKKQKSKKVKKIDNYFLNDVSEVKIINKYFLTVFILIILLLFISYFFKNSIPFIIQILFLVSGFFLWLSVKNKKNLNKNISEKNYEIYIVILLIITSSIIRFFYLGEKPEGINSDEELFANIGLVISSGGDPQTPFIGESDHQMGSPAYYLTGLFFKIFGVNLFSLRLFSNLSGIFSIITFYFFLRLFFNYQIAALASLLFCTNSVYIHVTRWMHIFSATPFFVWAGFLFLILGFKRNNLFFIILSGTLIGWSIYFYNSNKFLPVIFLLYIIYEILLNNKSDKKFYLKTIILFIVSFFIAFLPLFFYIINNFHTYFLHISGVKAKFNEILSKIPLYLGMLTYKGSSNPWLNLPNMPLLDKISSFLFLIGVPITFLTIKKRESFIAILLFVVGLIPAVFSNYWAEPNNQRGIIVFSSAFLFIAITINFLFSFWGKAGALIKYFMVILVLLSSINGVLTYFNRMLKNPDIIWSFSPYEYKIQKLYKENYKKYDIYFSKFFWGGNFGKRPFIGREIYFFNLPQPKLLDISFHSPVGLLMFNFKDKDVMLILEAFHLDIKNFLLKRFPNLTFEIIKNPYEMPKWEFDHYVLSPDVFNREILFVIVKIPRSDIENFKGLIFSSADGMVKQKLFLNGYDLKRSESGNIQGSIRIFEPGEYLFKFENFQIKTFKIDNKQIKIKEDISEPIKLYSGIHPLNIEIKKLNGNEKLFIKKIIKNISSEFNVVSPEMIITEILDCGFKGKIYKTRQENAELLWEEISPLIYNKWYETAIPGREDLGWNDSMRVIWESNLNIKKDGTYLFECPAPGGDLFIYINDDLVYKYKSSEGGRKFDFKWVDLNNGIYRFKLISDPFSIGTTNLLKVKIKENEKITILDDECLFKINR